MAGLAVTSAPAHAAPTLSVVPAQPIVGEQFTVTTRLARKVSRPAHLQQRVSGRWKTVVKGRSTTSGVVSLRMRATSSSARVRVFLPRTKVKSRTYRAASTATRTISLVTPTVALSLASRGSGGVDATVRSRPGRKGRTVLIQERTGSGEWREAGRRAMPASGVTTFPAVMTASRAKGKQVRALLGAWKGVARQASSIQRSPTITVATAELAAGTSTVELTARTTGPVERVRFFVDGRSVGDDTSAPWSVPWRVRSGKHDVTARAYGPLGSAVGQGQDLTRPEASVSTESGLADGFALDEVQSGFDLPTSFAPAPDSRVFVTEKAGKVRVVELGEDGSYAAPRTVLDIADLVLTEGDRGLMGIVLDPDFSRNGYVYLSYILNDGAPEAQNEQAQQLARFTWDGDQLDPATRHVVLGNVTGEACHATANLRTPDCVPMIGRSHSIGDMAFDDAGRLLVGIGDGTLFFSDGGFLGRPAAMRAQDPDILAGKILRIDPTTGRGVPGNPRYTAGGESNASRVVATGVRNPFRFTIRGAGDGNPANDTLVLGDVGESQTEEVNVLDLGSLRGSVPNFGWPCFEGKEPTNLRDVDDPSSPWHGCKAVREAHGHDATIPPALSYPHSGGGSVTGGIFLDSEAYPEEYRGTYVFGDYAQNFIQTADLQADGTFADSSLLADRTAAGGPVKFAKGPDGLLWYLSIYSGSLQRVLYEPAGATDRCETGTFRRTFHDLDGEDSTFDQEFTGEYAWMMPYAVTSLPAERLAEPTCEDGIRLRETAGSPWATAERPDTRAHPGDRFGTAWRGRVQVEGGTYRFTVSGSEWIRLWVDNEKLHDFYSNSFWNLEEVRQHEITLPAGQHTIRAELVHGDQRNASADISWERIGSPPTVRLTAPANGALLRDGRVNWEVMVSDPDGDDPAALRDGLVLTADLMHFDGEDFHAHPVARRTGAAAGGFDLTDEHAPGKSMFRLRARAVDASGATTTSVPVYVCLTGNRVGICED